MSLTAIILLIVLGLILVLVEVFIIPGSTFFGLIGLVLITIGIVYSFVVSRTAGFITLGGAILIISGMAYLGAQTKTWKMFEVKSKIIGTAAKKITLLKVGDLGKTTTRCNPVGKALFNGKLKEVYSASDMLAEDIKIKISRIENNQIFVKPI